MKTITVTEVVILEALGFLDAGEKITIEFFMNDENDIPIYLVTGEAELIDALSDFLCGLES